jgi:hypothetical protein
MLMENSTNTSYHFRDQPNVRTLQHIGLLQAGDIDGMERTNAHRHGIPRDSRPGELSRPPYTDRLAQRYRLHNVHDASTSLPFRC